MINLILVLLAAPTAINSVASPSEWHVRVSFEVGSDGRASGCHVLDSNAPVEMQTKTCQMLQEKGKFTPKRDKHGQAILPSVYKIVVRYRILPDNTPDHSQKHVIPDNPLLKPIHIGDWDGVCRKTKAADAYFRECVAQFTKPNMTGTMTRTYNGIEIAIRSRGCGTDEPIGRAKISRTFLKPPWDEQAFKGSLAGAIVVAKSKCPTMDPHVNVAGQLKDLLAATADLKK